VFGVGTVVRPDSPWSTSDPAILYRFGRDISERLRHRSNIIWNLGQDRDSGDHDGVATVDRSGPEQDWVLVLDSMFEDLAETDRIL